MKSDKYNYNEIKKIIKKKKVIYLDSFSLEIGLPILETQRLLNNLAYKYVAKVKVDENGKLIYIFDRGLEVQEEVFKFLYSLLGSFFSIFKSIFVSVSKILMLLVFISYSFIYFVLLSLGFLFSTILFSSIENLNDEKGTNQEKIGDYISDFFKMISYAFTLKSFHDDGYNKSAKRAFHIKIFSFVFGDDFKIENLNNDENILAFVKEYNKITLSDVINLTGLTEADSQNLILSLVVKYDGEILVNDDGIIHYKFNDFDFRGSIKQKYSYVWERKLPEYKLNKNDEDSNTKIIIFGIINLTLSSIITLGLLDDITMISKESLFYIKIWYGNISLFYSIIFFLVPIIRFPFVAYKKSLSNKINYIYYLFNDFSFNINRDNIDMDETDDNAEVYLFKNYPNVFVHDFIDNKNVIDVSKYHSEIKFTSNNDPKNIGIMSPDDIDFLDSFDF